MKNHLFIILFFLWVTACALAPHLYPIASYSEKSQASNFSKLDSIRHINFKAFYGQPIDSLLKHPLLQDYVAQRVVCESYGCLWAFMRSFKSKDDYLTILIFPPDTLQYVPRCVNFPREQWNLQRLKKERIAKVTF